MKFPSTLAKSAFAPFRKSSHAHLHRILAAYTGYYNELRMHLSLDKDSPGHRSIQRIGQIAAQPILGGLHHHYCRT